MESTHVSVTNKAIRSSSFILAFLDQSREPGTTESLHSNVQYFILFPVLYLLRIQYLKPWLYNPRDKIIGEGEMAHANILEKAEDRI